MTQRSPSSADRPQNRRDSTHPPRTRHAANGTPYPGAPTPPDIPGDTPRPRRTDTARASSRPRSAVPIPATVWASGPDPIDPRAVWPVPIIEAITASFTAPGAHVLLTSWPTPHAGGPGSGSGPDDHTGSLPDEGTVVAALDAVEALGRAASLARLVPEGALPGVSSRPFWAGFVTDTPAAHTAAHAGTTATVGARPTAGAERTAERVDLIITTLPADRAGDGSVDAVALAAADLLTVGGILAVYTHSDWASGRLVDPSGPMIAAGQSADLLYLQHIVTLHTPIRDGHLQLPHTSDSIAAHTHAQGRADVGDAGVAHALAHGDVLVFVQARDLSALPAGLAAKPGANPGDLR
ncbi:hypothetical protein [Amycolatopsis sp. H20-H5]|uniref:hypothetical protein n=1 Tax=Amycolatopsis sp. H20-H5 TaxID=3046309 RepID=UPI002DBF4025|nr:hypothetical protein [Amycolatopsis sp. H20-H5]MEC3979896.1 hypothetical protein [Amycolatopsis sp. H20-H5]